jgi:transposase
MGIPVRVGVDVAKDVFHVHAVDDLGNITAAKRLPRDKFLLWCGDLPAGCVVAMESCGTSHHWARQLAKLGLEPRLIAPCFAMPYRLEGPRMKNDAADAGAICEAASRPTMRYVPVKTPAQQGWLTMHRLRDGYSGERTAVVNRMRGLLSEFGFVFALSTSHLEENVAKILADRTNDLTPVARRGLKRLVAHLGHLDNEIDWCNEQIKLHVKQDPLARRAMTVLGVGVLGASAIVATVGDFRQFKNGRQFSAWLGLVPSQRSSGGRQRLGAITKRGDRYVRKLLVLGAGNALNTAAKRDDAMSKWALELRKRAPFRKTAVAFANKIARRLWHVMVDADAEEVVKRQRSSAPPLFTLAPRPSPTKTVDVGLSLGEAARWIDDGGAREALLTG